MTMKTKNSMNILAAIFMAVSVLFSVLSTADVHAEELFNAPPDHMQLIETPHADEPTYKTGHIGAICFHSVCHHINNSFYETVSIDVKPQLRIETLKPIYIAPQSYNLSSRLKRPPRT